MKHLAALACSLVLASVPAHADPTTAIVVTPFADARVVRGDDGKDHVEYNLLVTNAFTAPVALKSVAITDPSGKELMRLDGDALESATQTILDQKVLKEIPASTSAALEIDLIVEPGAVPASVSHRIAYDFAPDAPFASIIGSKEVVGPDVTVDTREAITILPPLAGPGWGALNGCCVPNIHRSVRVGAGSRIAAPETFAIDWIQIEGDKFFTGDGKANTDYPYFGAPLRSVADGEVVAARDGMEESIPFQQPTTVKAPGDYSGNYVMVRIRPDVYALYAHIKTGTVAVKVGDRVAAGATIGMLGNTGNSTNPHLHFGLLDAPDFLTANSVPFVFERYKLTGKVTGGDASGLKITSSAKDVSKAYPLVYGIATYE